MDSFNTFCITGKEINENYTKPFRKEGVSMSKSIMYSLAATVLWGIWGVTAKLSADRMGHWPSLFIYSTVSFLIILIIFIVTGSTLKYASTSGVFLAVTAGLAGGLAVASFQKAISCGPLSSSISLTSLYPLIPVLYGVLLLGEKITIAKGTGMGLAIVAGILICM